MELVEAVDQFLSSLIDVTYTHRIEENWNGERSKFLVNKRGTVYFFTAPYPCTDEEVIEELLNRMKKEL